MHPSYRSVTEIVQRSQRVGALLRCHPMRGRPTRLLTIGIAAALFAAGGCSGSDDGDAVGSTAAPVPSPSAVPPSTDPPATDSPATSAAPPTTELPPLTAADPALVAEIQATIDATPAGCDPLDTRQCVLPFPSDASTTADASAPTGRRVAFPSDGLPANAGGVHIDPTAWNRNDGFSANSPLLTFVADLDPAASALPPWTDLEASLDDDATVVVVDTTTGERVPLWAEPDSDTDDPLGHLLVIHPAISLAPATTYAVALRGLVTAAGTPVLATPTFTAYRDRLDTGIVTIEERRDDLEAGFAALADAGIDRQDLQLAWTFTTASTENVTAPMLSMRDEALTGLGEFSPEFEITAVTEAPEPGIGRFVEGTFSVPSFLTGDGSPGSSLVLGDDGLPEANGVLQAPFACVIGNAVLASPEPAHAVVYGHGLLGSHLEIKAGNVVAMSNEHAAVYCATKWAGFSEDDIPTAIAALDDLSTFPVFVDRMLQGFVNQVVLGRMLLADNGLASEPPFQRADGEPIFDTSEIVYDGNSQGGIMGIALAAISPDIERAVLGVVGMNYSTLLPRSVDFDTFETIFVPAYPSALDRTVALGVMQMLWDRAEGAGYVRHVVDDPLPGSTPTAVLLHVALGDWQVSELTAMVAARTMGIPIHRPVTADGRSREVEPGWAVETAEYGQATSALIVWDSGSDPIPVEQVPPSTSRDPHADPRNDADVRRQKAAFLFDGELIDVCAAAACTADVRD